jgi:Tfp pilus assembly protein PilX
MKIKMTNNNFKNLAEKKSGFALLFAIMASAVLFSIGISIWNLSFREVIISSFGKESQTAFYIADTALECGIYWDLQTHFATSSGDNTPHVPIFCSPGAPVNPTVVSDLYSAASTFNVSVGNGCATVVVRKDDADRDGKSSTEIESRGHNTCDVNDPTMVERGFKVNY